MARDLLDLHGLRVEQVEPVLDKFLVQLNNSSLKRARIMTGKGTGAVQKATIRYLKLAGYQWQHEKLSNGKPNEGCLVIFLD